MTSIRAAFDDIRLARRKIRIAQTEVEELVSGPHRDAAVMRCVALTDDLVRVVQEFSDLGFEEQMAAMVATSAAARA